MIIICRQLNLRDQTGSQATDVPFAPSIFQKMCHAKIFRPPRMFYREIIFEY
jgi:hypothetical protein